MSATRRDNRSNHQLREVVIKPVSHLHAEGAVEVSFGHTRILCLASVSKGVPKFLQDTNQGWVTAEYAMLPRATNTRNDRDGTRGRIAPRSIEIQRLISRSLRSMVDLSKIADYTIVVDCDVIQADGGTRTAAITGAAVALIQAIRTMQYQKLIKHDPLRYLLAAVSVGWSDEKGALLDLNYQEDSTIDTDMNVIMTEHGDLIEVQSTAEGNPLSPESFQTMLSLACDGIQELLDQQRQTLM
tara:strand:+ start:2669 stop:3394 length:726 start_codon:yes stop_codon:yes gene_type:complete